MKLLLAASICSLFLVAGSAYCAEFPEQSVVKIENAPDSELCISTAKAVKELRKDVYGRLHGIFRAPQTRSVDDVQSAGLTFYAQRTRQFTTVDGNAVERTSPVSHYVMDIDNDGSAETVKLVSGGLGAAGDGDVLSVLRRDLSSVPQPIAIQEFMDIPLEIGRGVLFYGAPAKFAPAYFIYPFRFRDRNYLLLEGNRIDDLRYLVVEIVPDRGIVTRCYF